MNETMRRATVAALPTCFAVAALLLAPACFAQGEASVRVPLAHGISFELPRDWKIAQGGELVTVDRAARELTRPVAPSGPQVASKLGFVAENYDSRGHRRAAVNMRYFPDGPFSQHEVRGWPDSRVAEFDSGLRDGIERGMRAVGGRLIAWGGTKSVDINGLRVLLTEYRRSTDLEPGVFNVQLVRVLAGPRSFTLTVSYRESDGPALAQTAQRIVSSVRQAP